MPRNARQGTLPLPWREIVVLLSEYYTFAFEYLYTAPVPLEADLLPSCFPAQISSKALESILALLKRKPVGKRSEDLSREPGPSPPGAYGERPGTYVDLVHSACAVLLNACGAKLKGKGRAWKS